MWPRCRISWPGRLRSISISLLIFAVALVIILDENGIIDEARKDIATLQKELELRVHQISNLETQTKLAGKADAQNVASGKKMGINGSNTVLEKKVNTKAVKPESKGEIPEGQSKPTVKAQTMTNTGSKVSHKVDMKGLTTEKAGETRKNNGTVEQGNILKSSEVQIMTAKPSLKTPKNVNPHDFAYLINNKSLCSPTEPLHHLIYFHSAPASASMRMALRNGWAQNGLFSKYPSRVVFFMGRTQDDNLMKDIRSEAEVFGDIVMEDYLDSYNNMTYKAIGALKWIMNFCNKTKYVIKADQDVYVNRFKTLQLLTGKHADKTRFFMCNVYYENDMPILRDPKTCAKWCVPKHIFPNQTSYPQYCAGAQYTFTTDIIKELYNASLSTPYFYIDDVYLTGILAKKVGRINYIDFGPGSFILGLEAKVKQAMHGKNATDHIMAIHDPYHDDPEYYWRDHLKRISPNQAAMLDKDKYQTLLQQTPSLQNTGK